MSTSDTKPILTSILLVAAVLALAGFLFLIQKLLPNSSENVAIQAQSAPEETEIDNSKTEILESVPPAPIETAPAKSKNAAETMITTGTQLITEAATGGLTEIATTEANQLPEVDQQSQDNTVQAEANTETPITVRALNSIKVPKSFSLKDASKYFIPKEERAPGNLGGPPPFTEEMLSIMEQGSPSGFAPPTAPGGNQ